MKKPVPTFNRVAFIKLVLMTLLVLGALMGGYKLRENYELQSPIVIKLQAPWKKVDAKKDKLISPISFVQQADAHEEPEINPDEVYEFDSDQVKAYLRQETIKEFGEKEWSSMEQLLDHESDYNLIAQNPTSTAFGIFQFLDSTWGSYGCKKTVKIKEQVRCGLKYIETRYETPSGALKHWLARKPIDGQDVGNWY